MMNLRASIVLLLLAFTLACCSKFQKISVNAAEDPLPRVVAQLVSDMQSMMDTTADPCTDFFQYACGTWVKENPVPANETDQVYMNVPDIMDIEASINAWAAEVVTQPWPIVNDLYTSCMQSADSLAQDVITTYLNFVKVLESTNVSSAQQRVDILRNTVLPFNVPASLVVNGNNNIYNILLELDGNTLSNGTYTPLYPGYTALMKEATAGFSLFESADDAASDAAAVLRVEAWIANLIGDGDPVNQSLTEFESATGVSWAVFFGDILNQDEYLQTSPYAVPFFAYFFSEISENTFRRFLEWKTYQTLIQGNISQCVGIPLNEAMKNINCIQYTQNVSPWDQHHLCSYIVYSLVPDYVNMIFAAEVINPDLIADIHQMTDDIMKGFSNNLPNVDWLAQNQSNIDAVNFKLEHIIQLIGHASTIDKYTGVDTTPTSFMTNAVSIIASANHFAALQWRVPYNRSNEQFPAELVNAFYDPTQNTISFPAGILESPMYSSTWPALWQYARMGYVVGHETIHGFDNSGSQYNAFGENIDIFDLKTQDLYNNKSQCIVDLYNSFIAYGNVTMNGAQTLGENIADIGGVKNSHRAYQLYVQRNGPEFNDGELIPNFTTEQVYFLIMGQTWCSVESEGYLKFQYKNDVHSPFKYRVNAPLSQYDSFAAAYNCPANTPMNPAERCDLW